MKDWKPIFINNSRVPEILSKFSPIDVWAISLGWFVWCRGNISKRTKRHEIIHFQQQLELAFIGQWSLYICWWLYGICRGKSGTEAYYDIPFERESFGNESDKKYLEKRKRYAWVKYIRRQHDFKERIKRARRTRITKSTKNIRIQRRDN